MSLVSQIRPLLDKCSIAAWQVHYSASRISVLHYRFDVDTSNVSSDEYLTASFPSFHQFLGLSRYQLQENQMTSVRPPHGQVCYRVPPSANVNPKALVLFVGDGSSGRSRPHEGSGVNQE
jgi:hypothetical protein